MDIKNSSAGFTASVESYSNYYPYGMEQPGRNFSSPDYRYGYNGKEKDNELKGEGNSYDYGARIYDPRNAKFLSTDPLQAQYPGQSPFVYAANSPIALIDRNGMGPLEFQYKDNGNSETETKNRENFQAVLDYLKEHNADGIFDDYRKHGIEVQIEFVDHNSWYIISPHPSYVLGAPVKITFQFNMKEMMLSNEGNTLSAAGIVLARFQEAWTETTNPYYNGEFSKNNWSDAAQKVGELGTGQVFSASRVYFSYESAGPLSKEFRSHTITDVPGRQNFQKKYDAATDADEKAYLKTILDRSAYYHKLANERLFEFGRDSYIDIVSQFEGLDFARDKNGKLAADLKPNRTLFLQNKIKAREILRQQIR